MVTIAMTSAIPADKLPSWKATVAEMTGPRRADFAASRRSQGVSRQEMWLQQGPDGPREILVVETEDPARTFELMATSDEPFDVWLRRQILHIFDLDLAQLAGPPPEQVLRWSAGEREEIGRS
jgi:hypothetical protein